MDQSSKLKRNKKYMCLDSNGQQYALVLSDVKEVIGLSTITVVPNSPNFLKGVINLRGRVITILDLATILNSRENTKAKRPSVVICTTSGDQQFGIVVDSVNEVVAIAEENINYDIQNLQFSVKAGVMGAVDLKDKGLTLILNLEKAMNTIGFNLSQSA